MREREGSGRGKVWEEERKEEIWRRKGEGRNTKLH